MGAEHDRHQLDVFWISKSKNPSRRYSPRKLGISYGYPLDSKVGSVTTCFITEVLVTWASDGQMSRYRVEGTHVFTAARLARDCKQAIVHVIRRGLSIVRRHLTAARVTTC